MYDKIGGYQDILSHTLKQIMVERVELYRTIPLPGYNIPTSVMPDHVYYSVPTEEEAVCRLRGHRLGVTYQMSTHDIRYWLREHQSAEAVAVAESEATERMAERNR